MGLANTRGCGAEARQHLAHVNGWSEAQTDEFVAAAFEAWRQSR